MSTTAEMDGHASSGGAVNVCPRCVWFYTSSFSRPHCNSSLKTNLEMHSRATSSSTPVQATHPSPIGHEMPLSESLADDMPDVTNHADEPDSNAELRKESLPNHDRHGAGHGAPKKVLYIPVSDNIGEVDARRLFNLLSQFDSVKTNSGKSYNYEEKYPEDAPGQELGEDARVFKVYNDLAGE
ncbi:hypothetical protein DL96DRAFT_1711582 [Flagelloscypha sp. PMI_526]|nr:hypothetical protein DL96DRAFT_1711582 [Flagelloscypha sp. PMI_526]